MTRTTSNLPATYQAQLLAEAQSIQGRISSPATGKIRWIGNHTIALPDGQEGEELEAVIIDFITVNSYFDQQYSPSNPVPPACVAMGYDVSTLAPLEQSPVPQCSNCLICPQNQFGSAGRGKACKNTRLIALTSVADEGEDPIMWTASIPPVSLKHFDAYVQKLATKMKTIPIGVVTRIFLRDDVAYPEPKFEVVRPLREAEFETYMRRREEAKAVLMTPPDLTGYRSPNGAPVRFQPKPGAAPAAAAAKPRRVLR